MVSFRTGGGYIPHSSSIVDAALSFASAPLRQNPSEISARQKIQEL